MVTGGVLHGICSIKSILKSLVLIGGHLSQSSEYRDMYEDFVLKVGVCQCICRVCMW